MGRNGADPDKPSFTTLPACPALSRSIVVVPEPGIEPGRSFGRGIYVPYLSSMIIGLALLRISSVAPTFVFPRFVRHLGKSEGDDLGGLSRLPQGRALNVTQSLGQRLVSGNGLDNPRPDPGPRRVGQESVPRLVHGVVFAR